jgi:hypothetical protein
VGILALLREFAKKLPIIAKGGGTKFVNTFDERFHAVVKYCIAATSRRAESSVTVGKL